MRLTRVRRANCQSVAEVVQSNLALYRVAEFARDLVAGESPADFAGADIGNHFLVGIDEIWLLVTEVE